MRDIYDHIVTISTIAAVTMTAVALIVRLVFRNQKAVEHNFDISIMEIMDPWRDAYRL